jgi:hypothetical protein
MTRKIVLLCFFTVPTEASRFASSYDASWGYKASSRSCATYILPHDLPPSPHLLPYG